MPADLRDVDPRDLRVLPSRSSGADPLKLARQIARYGSSTAGMPPLWVAEGADGVAKLKPGALVRVEVIARLRRAMASEPKIGDLLP